MGKLAFLSLRVQRNVKIELAMYSNILGLQCLTFILFCFITKTVF